jgi:hypothetical protein
MAALTQRTLAEERAKVETVEATKLPVERNWIYDEGKKNTETKPCGTCKLPFFGLRKRKRCVPCETELTASRARFHKALNDRPQDPRPQRH